MTPFLETLMAIGALCVACWVVFILIALLSVFARMWRGTTVQERAETGIGGVGDGAQDPGGGVMAHIDGDVVEPSDDPRWPTAVHEAGRAVIAKAVGRDIVRVTIERDGDSRGHVRTSPFPEEFDPATAYYDSRIRKQIEDRIMIMCAGGIAQGRVDLKEAAPLFDGESDYDNAMELARHASHGDDDEAVAYVEWLRLRTMRMIWNPIWWSGVESLAAALLAQPTMTGRQAYEAIQGGWTGSCHLSRVPARPPPSSRFVTQRPTIWPH